jgi:hypothetical protein
MGRQPCAKISQSLLQVDLKKGPGHILLVGPSSLSRAAVIWNRLDDTTGKRQACDFDLEWANELGYIWGSKKM